MNRLINQPMFDVRQSLLGVLRTCREECSSITDVNFDEPEVRRRLEDLRVSNQPFQKV